MNSAIVLIDAANTRIAAGMRPLHATVYAARRRVIPVIMTTSTTIAGLFSLAVGLGGKSLVWGPVASSIVAGLGVATILTFLSSQSCTACSCAVMGETPSRSGCEGCAAQSFEYRRPCGRRAQITAEVRGALPLIDAVGYSIAQGNGLVVQPQ